MTTSHIAIKETAADKRAATYQITEDAVAKQVQRVVLNSDEGGLVDIDALLSGIADGQATQSALLTSIESSVNAGHTIAAVKAEGVSIASAGWTELYTLTVGRANVVRVQVRVANQALQGFRILAKVHADADWLLLADPTKWLGPDDPDSNQAPGSDVFFVTDGDDLSALAAGDDAALGLTVDGWALVRFEARAATGTASMDIYLQPAR